MSVYVLRVWRDDRLAYKHSFDGLSVATAEMWGHIQMIERRYNCCHETVGDKVVVKGYCFEVTQE